VRKIIRFVRRRGWHLIAVAIVVAGLAISAPPSAVGAPGDHFGALVHPIFPHVHGDGHTFAAEDSRESLASHEPASHDVAPGLSVPLASAGAREAAAGIVMPFVLAYLLVELTRRRYLFEPLLAGRAVSPPTPPPRMHSRNI
jgi:hypothetical protein